MEKKTLILLLSIVIVLIIGSLIVLNGNLLNPNIASSNFTDIGTSKNSSTDWYLLSNVTKKIDDNGTTLSSIGDQGAYANKPSTSNGWKDTFEWSSPFTIEFDVLNWDGTVSMRIFNTTNSANKDFDELHIQNGSHVKIVSTNNSTTYIIDGKTLPPINQTFTNAQIGFRLDNATLDYKNFKIYQ